MIYQIGDKFLVNDVEAQVVYVNGDKAWLAPQHGSTHVCFARLDETGHTKDGHKAIVLVNRDCLAV